MKVFNDLRNRGITDILIAVTNGFKGIAETLEAVFPATTLQTCIVHLIRNSLEYASWKERRELGAALKPIYTAVDVQTAETELSAFEQSPWGERYPTVTQAWRHAWDRVVPFFAFAPQVRKLIYTTNPIESLHSQLRKIIRTRGHFPSDEATTAIPIGRTWTTDLAYQLENPNVEVGWRGRYVQSAGYIPSSRGSSTTPELVRRSGYGVNDIYANWKPFGTDDLNVNFAVNNLFNKYYKSHSQRSGVSSLPEPGRDVRLNVSYRF